MKDEYVRKAHRFSLRWDLGRAGGPAFTRTGVNLSRLRGEGVDMGGDADGVDIASLTPMRAALRVGRAFGASRLLDSAPPRCAMVLYDTAVGMSASCAEALARQALGLPSGAAWNAALRSALRRCDDRRTALAMCHLRRARYCALAARHPAFQPSLPGCLGRVDALEAEIDACWNAGRSSRPGSGTEPSRRKGRQTAQGADARPAGASC